MNFWLIVRKWFTNRLKCSKFTKNWRKKNRLYTYIRGELLQSSLFTLVEEVLNAERIEAILLKETKA